MPNLNTAKLQTYVSFCENFHSTQEEFTKWHFPLEIVYKPVFHEPARALMSFCAVKFSRKIILEPAHAR